MSLKDLVFQSTKSKMSSSELDRLILPIVILVNEDAE
jgi:hypothetical protein